MKLLFIDESGDHNLNLDKIDSQFPIFVLTGIVFEKSVFLIFKKNLGNFKLEIFGTKKVFLHARELTRPNITKQKEIGSLTDKIKRRKFYDQLNKLLSNTNFKVYSFVLTRYGLQKILENFLQIHIS